MNKDDSDRVFDVSKPNKSTPSPTSRPIIVGHHPMMSDPMVKEDNEDQESTPTTMHKSIPIQGSDDPAQTPDDVSPTLAPAMVQHPESVKAAVGPPPVLNEAPAPINQMPSDDLHLASLDDLIGHEHKPPEHQTPEHQPIEHQHSEHHGTVVHPHQDHSHEDHNHDDSSPTVAHTTQRAHMTGDKKLSVLLVLLLVLVAGYLAIDSRLIKTSINLPLHVFKQPAPAVVVQPVVTKAAAKSTATTSTTTDPYADWKTYSSSDLALSFKHPSTWSAVANPAQCTGAIQVVVTPSTADISDTASKTSNTSLKKLYMVVNQFGTPSSNCSADGSDFKGGKYSYLKSSDQITEGALKGDSLTFFGSTTKSNTTALPDTGIITGTKYSGDQLAFVDSGTITAKNKTYQIDIYTDTGQYVQSPVPVQFSPDSLKTTSFYKDMVLLLNSMQ